MLLDSAGQGGQHGPGFVVFGGRHQTEVPGGRLDFRIARQHPEHRNTGGAQGGDDFIRVPGAARLVEHHPGDPYRRVEAGQARHHRRVRPGRVRDVDDQQHRTRGQRRDVGRGGFTARTEPAVEKPHHAFDHGDIGTRGAVQQQRHDPVRADQVGVEVAGRTPGRQCVIARIDVVRAYLVPTDLQSARSQCRHHPDRHGGLAVPGCGCGHHQPGRQGNHAPTTQCRAGPSDRRPSDASPWSSR